ncbi:metallophosphoesterase [Pedobacter panaciterrae]|uniref:Metallophosphoesterase n=1 Tax=Pedobacter panaciterrae TaxID=363849 RepID=A0ABU8NN13_9SPHI|nr:metallophosphoesterase [uncultured Pedobacter sp.]
MKLTRRKFIRAGLLATFGTILADMFWIEKFFIETNEFYIGKATKETTHIKVVQISDLHLQSVNYQLKHLANKLNKLQPQLILITGDAIDKSENTPLLNEFLKLIDKEIKKVAILGNWEYWGNIDLDELNKIYAGNNCTLLINETTQYSFKNKSISITGVDDFIGGKADYGTAIKGYKKSDYHIVLNHCPQYSDYISSQTDKDTNIDFILSGHTHGGQINLFGYAPFLPPGSGKYVKGWYNHNVPKMYVSKGVGTSILPARFGARAEIAIFNLL